MRWRLRQWSLRINHGAACRAITLFQQALSKPHLSQSSSYRARRLPHLPVPIHSAYRRPPGGSGRARSDFPPRLPGPWPEPELLDDRGTPALGWLSPTRATPRAPIWRSSSIPTAGMSPGPGIVGTSHFRHVHAQATRWSRPSIVRPREHLRSTAAGTSDRRGYLTTLLRLGAGDSVSLASDQNRRMECHGCLHFQCLVAWLPRRSLKLKCSQVFAAS